MISGNEMDEAKTEQEPLIEALKQLLHNQKSSTQEQICQALEAQGHEINQSKVSRLLRKINAVKVVNARGLTIYSLPREPAPPTINSRLKNLIVDVVHNETLVVIFTSPGCASMVARILDHNQITTEILGTIAGDDTIFVAPKSISTVKKLDQEIKALLVD